MSESLSKHDVFDSIYAAAILIIDDNEINQIFILKILRTRGFKNLLAVGSSEEAFVKLKEFNPDIIILDILMDGMDGFEFCNNLRKKSEYADLPVLVQTTLTAPELRVKAFAQGASDFISKPIYPDELCARVMVHLEKRLCINKLSNYKERISNELKAAVELQQSILPSKDEINYSEKASYLDIASHFAPSSEIGGDFWGMKNIFLHQTAAWIVDFSGHGVASALNSFRLQAYLKERSNSESKPGEYLSLLNEKLLSLFLNSQFATMFYGIIDSQGNKLIYSTAASPNPIIIRAETGKADIISGDGLPLGISINQYETKIVPFYSGDILLLYSDTFIETEKKLKYDGNEYVTESEIAEIISENRNLSSDEIMKILLAYFEQETITPIDDLTACLIKRN